MSRLGQSLELFLERAVPSVSDALILLPLLILVLGFGFWFCGWLQVRRGWKTGYTRKLIHVVVFSTAALLQWQGGFSWVCIMGVAVGLVVLYGVFRGDGSYFFEGIARETDAPHRVYYVLVPFLATLVGGVLANLLFGIWSIVGFLVTGLGDAVGEPVGVRFGKHPYRVPARRGVPTTRTLEGSLAIFFVCCLAIVLGIRMVSGLWVPAADTGRVVLAGLVCTLIEASAPHGWDNALLQIGGAAAVSLFWLGI